jgi:trehalose utilization protein
LTGLLAGKGWFFYLQPGHAESDFRNRNYCQIILNCLTWQPPAGAAAKQIAARRGRHGHATAWPCHPA